MRNIVFIQYIHEIFRFEEIRTISNFSEERKERKGSFEDWTERRRRTTRRRSSGSARDESANKLISLADNQVALPHSNNAVRAFRVRNVVSSNRCQERVGETVRRNAFKQSSYGM